MSQSIGALGKRFGLSRSALLYYDRIGLLSPSERSAAGYRRYSERDARRLEAICRYREVGLGLEEIHELLEEGAGDAARDDDAGPTEGAEGGEGGAGSTGEGPRTADSVAARRDRTTEILEARLVQLSTELERLREQQRVVLRLLASPGPRQTSRARHRAIDKRRWVEILRATGLDDATMHRWHREFERMAPEAHQAFLESLGMPRAEVRRLRRGAAAGRAGARR